MKPGSPRLDVSWDGTAFRVETEAYVLLHELAHIRRRDSVTLSCSGMS